MSDTPQGPDWWQASDDKWYPPPRPAMPGDAAATAVPAPGMPPPGAPPMGPPTGPPTGPPSGGFPAGPPSGGFPPPGPTSGPYGPSLGAPPSGGQNRTPLFIAIGVVAAAAIVGLIVLLSSGDDETEPTASSTTQPSGGSDTTAVPANNPPATPSDDTPAGSAEIQVVESGFSNFMGGYDDDERSVAYGFIVENTGDETATDISISISAYDAAGTALASDSVTVYVLRPGERMGVGDEFFGTTFATEVDRVDVQVGEPSGFGSSDVPDEGTLTAEGINTAVSDYDMKTTFTAKSTYAQQIDSPYAYAIYRNDAGEIIGGSYGFLDFIPANGSTAAEIASWEAIPGVASTEVYLDPGWF